MTARVPMHVIKGGLQGRLLQLVRELVPGATERELRGNVCQPKNPTRPDATAGSFTIWMRGQAAGAWKDYATGDQGDVIDLVRYCRGGDRADAIRWSLDWLGLALVDAATLARMNAERDVRRRANETAQRETDARIIARAERLWRAATPDIQGTLAEIYLATRGLPIREIPGFEWADVRFMPALEWWRHPGHDADGVVVARPRFPAMVWAVRQPDGALSAVHCTFLRADGLKKAHVGNPKLMLGLVAGGVIRLVRGPSGLTAEAARDAEISGLLGVGEGVEDGLTIALAAPEARVWAVTSLGNLGNLPVGHPCVSAVVVAQDNDWGKAQAREAFETAMERIEAAGKPVTVVRSRWGKDLNDALTEKDVSDE